MTPRGLRWGAALSVLVAACGDSGTGPDSTPLEIVATAGQGAFVVPGDVVRLEAVVREVPVGTPREGVEVNWRVVAGEADELPGSGAGRVSDSEGRVWTRVRSGGRAGAVEVRVSIQGRDELEARFDVTTGGRPVLTAVSPTGAPPGTQVTLEGSGFSLRDEQNVVLFDGIRGAVTAAAPARLEVEVPPCLPEGPVEVTAQLGALVSEPAPFRVDQGGAGPGPAPGAWLDVEDPAAPGCLRLEGGSTYLVLAAAYATVAGARHPVTLRGVSGDPPVAAPLRPRSPPAGPTPATEWDRLLRAREETATRDRAVSVSGGGRAPRTPVAQAPRVPSVGDRRTFRVLNVDRELEEVTAEARYVGTHAAAYVDRSAPPGGFRREDLSALVRRFDERVHPTVTGVFGEESDLDGNGRVALLFTPVVNRLTPPGADGFVGGFFFGTDLLEGEEGNGGEVLYALVPDPYGVHADRRTREELLPSLHAVLAHEFQHLVHFRQRALLRGGVGTGALWLSEGLAQMAEELVAREHQRRGETAWAEQLRAGNRTRARLYLADPSAVGLVASSGRGSLAERGAAWLFALYLEDRGGPRVLRDLTATRRTGVDNVTAATGGPWRDLVADWWTALHLEGAGGAERYGLGYDRVELARLLGAGEGGWPLVPTEVRAGGFLLTDTLWSSSVRHYLLEPPEGGPVVLRMAGEVGAAGPPGSDLGLRVLRLLKAGPGDADPR